MLWVKNTRTCLLGRDRRIKLGRDHSGMSQNRPACLCESIKVPVTRLCHVVDGRCRRGRSPALMLLRRQPRAM